MRSTVLFSYVLIKKNICQDPIASLWSFLFHTINRFFKNFAVYDNYSNYYYGTSPPSYFLADDCDCNKGDCPPGTQWQGSCGDDMNYCC